MQVSPFGPLCSLHVPTMRPFSMSPPRRAPCEVGKQQNTPQRLDIHTRAVTLGIVAPSLCLIPMVVFLHL